MGYHDNNNCCQAPKEGEERAPSHHAVRPKSGRARAPPLKHRNMSSLQGMTQAIQAANRMVDKEQAQQQGVIHYQHCIRILCEHEGVSTH